MYTYQLAVVVDDADQGVTEVVRGADLLGSTARRLVLQDALALPRLQCARLPVVVDARGLKLSKQTSAEPIQDSQPLPALLIELRMLGQPKPSATNLHDLWSAAMANWNEAAIPRSPVTW